MRNGRASADRGCRVERLEHRAHFDVAAPGDVVATVNHPTTGHTYHLLAPTTWEDAEARSKALGGHLVVINDQAEHDFVWSTFGPTTGLIWIGIHDTAREGQFVWTTGEPVGYTNWFAGEPNNLYPSGERWGNMWVDYGSQWNDLGPDSDQGTVHHAVAEIRNGPDLFAAVNDVPGSLQPGGSFVLGGTVRNLGSVAPAADARVSHFVSADRTLDAADRLVASQEIATAGLAFDASVAFSADVILPADVPAGTYFLLSQVDSDAAVAEADETNNVAASRAFDLGAVLVPVLRTVRGFVRDADDLPLHGVLVRAGDGVTHTDYDGRKGSLDRDGVNGDFDLAGVLVGHNVTFSGNFGRFAAADGDAAQIVATAADLAGGAYEARVNIDEVLTFDATQPDGGLPANAPATLRPIFFTDYETVALDGSVRLHKDLRNDKNSDRISTKLNKALAASARYRKGVEVVTARLSALGFLEAPGTPLASVAQLKRNAPAERALKLFKEIRFAPAKPKVAAKVDETTLAALNAVDPAAGPMWTSVLPPKWTAAPGLTDTYVHRGTFEKMRQLAEASSATGFVVTRASHPLGGTGKTFRTGGEIEFRWIDTAGTSQTAGSFWEPLATTNPQSVTLLGRKRLGVPDPAELGITWRYVDGYDQARTADAIRFLLDNGVTHVRFNDPAILQDLGAISIPSAGPRTLTLTRADLQPAAGNDMAVYASFAFPA